MDPSPRVRICWEHTPLGGKRDVFKIPGAAKRGTCCEELKLETQARRKGGQEKRKELEIGEVTVRCELAKVTDTRSSRRTPLAEQPLEVNRQFPIVNEFE